MKLSASLLRSFMMKLSSSKNLLFVAYLLGRAPIMADLILESILLQKSSLVLRTRLLILSKTSSISGSPSLGGGWVASFWMIISLV